MAPKFRVPFEAPWPQSIWGLKLGYRLRNIRYRGDFINERPECQKLLEELGFNCGKLRCGELTPGATSRKGKNGVNTKVPPRALVDERDVLPLNVVLEKSAERKRALTAAVTAAASTAADGNDTAERRERKDG